MVVVGLRKPYTKTEVGLWCMMFIKKTCYVVAFNKIEIPEMHFQDQKYSNDINQKIMN